jgi:hypothetical protein
MCVCLLFYMACLGISRKKANMIMGHTHMYMSRPSYREKHKLYDKGTHTWICLVLHIEKKRKFYKGTHTWICLVLHIEKQNRNDTCMTRGWDTHVHMSDVYSNQGKRRDTTRPTHVRVYPCHISVL